MKLNTSDSSCTKCFDEFVKGVIYFGVSDLSTPPVKDINGLLLVEILVQVDNYTKRNGGKKQIIHFIIRRESLTNRWLINQDSLYKGLK